MLKFEDLVFVEHIPEHKQAMANGYSIINGKYCNGGSPNLYEVMDREGEVHAYLTPQQVEEIINK